MRGIISCKGGYKNILVVLLAIVATEGSIMWEILLLLLYSLGHSFLVVVAGTSVGFVNKLSESGAYDMTSKIIKTVMGTIILFLGMYMLYLGF
ncbi:MAG: hypothetical protein PHG42_08180 [Bacteroides sp.]|nr:hypothetical protein [Fermentimonas sp.]MDD4055749.1 hypothetical protein [Bacteroides sp.]